MNLSHLGQSLANTDSELIIVSMSKWTEMGKRITPADDYELCRTVGFLEKLCVVTKTLTSATMQVDSDESKASTNSSHISHLVVNSTNYLLQNKAQQISALRFQSKALLQYRTWKWNFWKASQIFLICFSRQALLVAIKRFVFWLIGSRIQF